MARKSTDTTSDAPRVLLYQGADDALKRKQIEKLTGDLTDADYRDFDLEQVYGPDATADRILAAASIPPIASNRRLVIVFQANEMPGVEQEALGKRLDRIPESACVLLVCPAPAIGPDGKPKKSSTLDKELTAPLKKVGKTVDFPLLKDQAAVPLVQQMVQAAGKTISYTSAAELVQRSGTDTGTLQNEVDKLVAYVGDSDRILDDDVHQVTTETIEEKIFAMMDAVGSKEAGKALQLLRPLLYGGGGRIEGPALRTLAMLARHFRELWQARILTDAGWKFTMPTVVPPQVESELPRDSNILKNQDWKNKKLVAQSKNFTLEQLSEAFEKMAAAEFGMKGIEGGISDPGMALEMLIIQLSTRTNAKKGR